MPGGLHFKVAKVAQELEKKEGRESMKVWQICRKYDELQAKANGLRESKRILEESTNTAVTVDALRILEKEFAAAEDEFTRFENMEFTRVDG